jgi:uncharacterized protein (DUF697 family)/predicted GTPase
MWWERYFTPKAEANEDEIVAEVRATLPVPVFWLLGKTQSGKTSIIRALSGSTRAEIGNGFRPCTKTASLYPFPGESDPILQFLDTRGLGETSYDPTEDLAVLSDQAHLLLVVVKATDHALAPLVDALETIRRRKPRWPVVVVQTCLHEGYPTPETEHLLPYPYDQDPLPPEILANLRRSLMQQREVFRPFKPERFVAVDLTQAEDGYEPQEYGLDALWTAIEEVLPLGLRRVMEESATLRREMDDANFREAHPHIVSAAMAAGAGAAVPVPLVEIPATLAIQMRLLQRIAKIYGRPFNTQLVAEIGGALGVGFLGRMGIRGLTKAIPFVGSGVTGMYAAASTYALGRTLCTYFSVVRQGGEANQETFQRIYREQYEHGQEALSEYLKTMRSKKK